MQVSPHMTSQVENDILKEFPSFQRWLMNYRIYSISIHDHIYTVDSTAPATSPVTQLVLAASTRENPTDHTTCTSPGQHTNLCMHMV